MKLTLTLLLVALAVPAAGQGVRFGKWFDGRTLRLDCVREGGAVRDTVWVEYWVDRQAEWHGPRRVLVDPFDNGDYRVEMRDARSGRVIYSRGYSNLLREYRDTPEAKLRDGRFEEVLLLPMPKRAVQIALQRRDDRQQLVDQTVVAFDPRHDSLEVRFRAGESVGLLHNGDPASKIDVAIVAQGYGEADRTKMRVDYYRMKEILLGKEPFASHAADFNLYGVRGDAGARYGTFGADRYLMTFDLFRLHDLLGTTPCDYIVIMVNDTVYGGGAIYNFYAVSSLHPMAEFVLPHELGHGIGGLADEYVDEDLSYADLHRKPLEPLEPNITNLVDFDRKWKHLLPEGTAVPTPARQVPRTECGPLGVYEGAGYSNKGVYRPAMNCMMRNYAPFCPVCRERMEAVFGIYTK